MRSERGVWQFGKFDKSVGQTSGELSTVGAEGVLLTVAPTVGVVVFAAVAVDFD
jgi:hypothetical protein